MPSFIPIEDSELKAGVDALIEDVVNTTGLTREQAVDLVHGRVEDHLGFLYSAGQQEAVSQILAWVVEAVQDDIIEGSGDLPRAVVWPRCPDHPNHPLWLAEFWPNAVWTCSTSGRVVAALGGL